MYFLRMKKFELKFEKDTPRPIEIEYYIEQDK